MSKKNQHSDFGLDEKRMDVYVVGILTCIFLTLIPFGAIIYPVLSHATTVGLVVACALSQFFVQCVCFLRLNYHTEQAKLNIDSFMYFLFVVFILIAGSLWIMSNLNYFMHH